MPQSSESRRKGGQAAEVGPGDRIPPGPPRRRLPYIATAVAAVVILAGAWGLQRRGRLHQRPPAKPKPNLLLITLDTTRADHLGCYGAAAAQTPNLDQLAAEGVRFAQCATCSPLTLPSHASIMTGACPFGHGARRNGASHVSAGCPTLAKTLRAAGFRTRAAVASFVLNRQFGLDQGFEVYHDVVPPAAGDPLQAERRADAVGDDALELLRSVQHDRFFLWLHFYDPHAPYLSAQHADQASPEAYADEVTFMDEHVGYLLAELCRLQLDADTLVVAVGDHGEGLGQHDEPTHGYFLYDTTLHVPLIMRGPGTGGGGRVVAAPVRTIDLAPTILELLDCPPLPESAGRSFVPLLSGNGSAAPRPAYAETFEAYAQFGLSPLRSLTLDNWKFILAPQAELYDRAVDPGETDNLAAAQPERVAQLQEALRTFIADAPPPAPTDPQAGMTTDEVRRLQALGYVAAAASMPSDMPGELDSLAPRGGNPRDFARLLQLNSQAREALAAGRFAAAERTFRETIAALPEAPQPYAGLAEALRGQQRLGEALAAVQEAVARAPDDTYIRGTYGSLLADAGQWAEAAEQFRTVLRQSPRDIVMLHSMGIALAFLERFDEAEQHFQLALSIEPDNPRLLHAMGVLRTRQGRLAEAIDYLRRAVTKDPDFAQAAQDLQQVEALSNNK